MSTTPTATTRTDWLSLYEDLTPNERDEITIEMLRRVESRQRETIQYLKKTPLALDGLPVSKLMDVVEDALSEAYDWIVENFPQAREKLEAYDSLTVFYQDQGEKSERDIREAIDAICKAWGVTMFPVSTETEKPIAKSKDKPARSH